MIDTAALFDELEKIALVGGSTGKAWAVRALTGAAPGAMIGAGVGDVATKKEDRGKKRGNRNVLIGAGTGALAGAAGGAGIGRYMQHRSSKVADEVFKHNIGRARNVYDAARKGLRGDLEAQVKNRGIPDGEEYVKRNFREGMAQIRERINPGVKTEVERRKATLQELADSPFKSLHAVDV
jgi:hypothetical protein